MPRLLTTVERVSVRRNEYSQNLLQKDVSLRDINAVYNSGKVDFPLAFLSGEFTNSFFVKKLLTEKFLSGAPVEADPR